MMRLNGCVLLSRERPSRRAYVARQACRKPHADGACLPRICAARLKNCVARPGMKSKERRGSPLWLPTGSRFKSSRFKDYGINALRFLTVF